MKRRRPARHLGGPRTVKPRSWTLSVLKGTTTVAPCTYPWTFSSANNGTHSWTARAYDGAGNREVS